MARKVVLTWRDYKAVNASALKRMRIILQQKTTGLYFQDIGAWSPDSSHAMDFMSSTGAIEFCALNKLHGMQLVLKFESEKFDLVLPVGKQQMQEHAKESHRA